MLVDSAGMASMVAALAETLLPASCAVCRLPLEWAGSRSGVCGRCWSAVLPHPGPGCPTCGDPVAAADEPCLECRTAPPPWHAAVSHGPYEGVLRDLVVLFKERGIDELAAPLAALAAAAARGAGWPPADAVVPVPTAWTRRWRRGFDHTALLARQVARILGVPARHALRRRGSGRQVGRTRAERLRLTPAQFPAVGPIGGRLIVVDDVLTTGGTARACAAALRRAGAAEVRVLTLARTPQSGRMP
jgi:ComF family protein